jgi:DNA-binding NtrC family response regulator
VKLLIVDDSADLRASLVSLFRDLGHEVVESGSVVGGAYQLGLTFRGQPFDVVITDFNLGTKETGLDLLAMTKEVSPDSRRILMSGNDQRDIGDAHLFWPKGNLEELLKEVGHA